MSSFICAHGELFCNCKYCSDFEARDKEDEYVEDEPLLQDIVNRIRKEEKIEY